ncbi:MAG TPA: trypsin-like peptidase domain-containing protein [Chloroflexota bacterium]|nr:trypsin-like peptidase domain-containing protein [Chloroflexota bacterium]
MATNNSLTDLSNQLADAVETAAKALVTVKGRARQSASGVVYAPGLVLTANHVLERDEDLSIVEPGGASMPAQLAGRDPATDLAVLRVAGLDLPPATAGGAARTGQLVLAIGRPGPMASFGIVSFVGGPLRTGRGLSLEQFIRTDATPYPGFSGGPLIDASGAVLGITTTAFGGAALAIPQTLAWRVAAALTEHGTPKRGYIGISSQPVRMPAGSKQESGLLVVNIEDNSPASKGGLMLGDILIALDGQPAGDTDDLLQLLSGERVGKAMKLEVIRGGKPEIVELTVGQRS